MKVTCTYLRDVYLPDYHKGKTGEEKELPERDAIELAEKGYVTFAGFKPKEQDEPA